jgi:hypothetical protein
LRENRKIYLKETMRKLENKRFIYRNNSVKIIKQQIKLLKEKVANITTISIEAFYQKRGNNFMEK